MSEVHLIRQIRKRGFSHNAAATIVQELGCDSNDAELLSEWLNETTEFFANVLCEEGENSATRMLYHMLAAQAECMQTFGNENYENLPIELWLCAFGSSHIPRGGTTIFSRKRFYMAAFKTMKVIAEEKKIFS